MPKIGKKTATETAKVKSRKKDKQVPVPQTRAVFSGPEGLRPYRKRVIDQRSVSYISPILRTELESSFKDPPSCPCPKSCSRWVGEIGWWHTIPDCSYTYERLKPFQFPKPER